MAEEERATAIGFLLDRLRSLGGRVPGSVLTSDDWNGLVDAMTTVVRLSTGAGSRVPGPAPGAPGELPPGSVGLEELAPEVQNLLRSGPFADPDKLGGRLTLERRLAAATERLASVEARLDTLLAAQHRTETDLPRQGSDLRLVDQRVAGAGGLRAEVGDLRTLLGSVRTDVADALTLRQQLAGVDLGELALGGHRAGGVPQRLARPRRPAADVRRARPPVDRGGRPGHHRRRAGDDPRLPVRPVRRRPRPDPDRGDQRPPYRGGGRP